MYLRCPAQYYFRYILEKKIPPKISQIKGRAIHKGQEFNYKQKKETKEDLPLDTIQDFVAETFEKEIKENEVEKDEDEGKAKDDAVTLATLYHQQIAPTVMPEYVEQEIDIELPDLKIVTILDLSTEDGYIRDTKTAQRTPAEDQLQKSLQAFAYIYAYRLAKNDKEKGFLFDYLINTKQPKLQTFELKIEDQQIDRFLKIARSVKHAIENEIFYPNTENFMCNPNACGYWELCKKEF